MIIKFLLFLLGKKFSWRVGRSLYMQARGDIANDMPTNGERMVQRCVVEGWARSSHSEDECVIFDVGANVGDWSASLLDTLASSSVICSRVSVHLFEPVPVTYGVLKKRLEKQYEKANLNFQCLALSSSTGEEKMYVSNGSGTNSFHADQSNKDNVLIVQKITLEAYCRNSGITRVALAKSDTEGHDMDFIRGAISCLENGTIDVLQFEYNHRWIFSRHCLKDVFDLLQGIPYVLGKIQPNHVLIYKKWHHELDKFFEANYILIHRDCLAWFTVVEAEYSTSNTIT